MGTFYRVPLIVLFIASVVNFLQAFLGLRTTINAFIACSLPAVRPFSDWSLSGLVTLLHFAFFLYILATSRNWATLSEQLPEELVPAPGTRNRKSPMRKFHETLTRAWAKLGSRSQSTPQERRHLPPSSSTS